MSNFPKIVLFDDDEANIKLFQNHFKNDFSVSGFQNPHSYQLAVQDDLSAILIDVIMPVMDGIELSGQIKFHALYNGCPIIFMSSSGCEEVKLKALGNGGHDFLSREMGREEMISRIKNKIDYFRNNRLIFQVGNVKLNMFELKAYSANELVELTLTELKIMKYLLREFPHLSTREEISQEVWPGQKVLPSTLNTHLSNLRNKFPLWEYDIQIIKSMGLGLTLKTHGANS